MVAFLQTYGFWIILIALFLLMMRMHGGQGGHGMGGGCGMGGMEHDQPDGHHQHTGSAPKSADQARVVPANEDWRDDSHPYQGRVRDLPTQEATEWSEDQPSVAPPQVHEYERA